MGTLIATRSRADDNNYIPSHQSPVRPNVSELSSYSELLRTGNRTHNLAHEGASPVYISRREEVRCSAFLKRLAVKVGSKIILVQLRDVLWIQSMGNLVRLQLREARYDYRMTMAHLQHRLDPESFVRVHRCAIVNLDYVLEFDLPDNGNAFVHMANGKSVPISKAGRSVLRKDLLTGAYSHKDHV